MKLTKSIALKIHKPRKEINPIPDQTKPSVGDKEPHLKHKSNKV